MTHSADIPKWGADFERFDKPDLERAMKDGPLVAWASLHHDTGGLWNLKHVYWAESWDRIDGLLMTLGAARRESGLGMESLRMVRAMPTTSGGRCPGPATDRDGARPSTFVGSRGARTGSSPRGHTGLPEMRYSTTGVPFTLQRDCSASHDGRTA